MHLRRHLRLWAALSLLLQSAWLFALVPRDCCAAHQPAADACHEEVAPPPHCPMQAVDGAACPMHQSPNPATHDCGMRGNCSGPMGALLALLSAHAVLPDSRPALSASPSAAAPPPAHERLIAQFVPPDSPPPRA